LTGARRLAAFLGVVAAAALAAAPGPVGSDDKPLPDLGSELGALPDGSMKALADQACLRCHSADMFRGRA
jgi:hypothetical protein